MNDTKTNRIKLARKIRKINEELSIPSSKTRTMADLYDVSELSEMLDQKNILLNYKIRREFCG